MNKFAELMVNEESGQGLVEYALIIALIAVVCVAAITALGGKIRNMFNNMALVDEGALRIVDPSDDV